MSQSLEQQIQRLESICDRLEQNLHLGGGAVAATAKPTATTATKPTSTTATSATTSNSTTAALQSYNELLTTHLPPVITAAQALGGEVLTATTLFTDGYKGEAVIIEAMTVCSKPDVPQLQTLLQPVGEKMMEVGNLRAGPRSDFVQHLKFVSEAVQALSWVAYTGPGCGMDLPSKHVENCWGAAEFYGNKILMEWKNKEGGENHVKWVGAIKELTMGLKALCSRCFVAGPVWCTGASAIPVSQFKPGSSTAKAAAPATKKGPPGGPPPPPPPPPGGLASLVAAKQQQTTKPADTNAGNPMAALFAEINKGEGITKGLRKVTDDMKTKNRTDKSGVVPVAATTTSRPSSASTTTTTTKPSGTPRVECEQGRKWVVEHQVDNRNIIISETEPKQSVYIFGCVNSTIQVSGKVNAITLDGCTRCGLLFESVVSSCEVVNCKSMEVQCTGSVPTMAVDKTDGCQLYLTRECLPMTDITTAKASTVNVIIPGETEESDPVENAIPEQFVTKWVNGRFVTEAVTHSGG